MITLLLHHVPHSHVHKLMTHARCALDVMSVPYKLANHLMLTTGQVKYGTETLATSVTLSARAYFMGQRVMNTSAKSPIAATLNSILATPSFYNSPQFTSVLFKERMHGSERYRIGQVRLLFSVPGVQSKTKAGAVLARLSPPVKYALVQLFDRVMPSSSPAGLAEGEIPCGHSLLELQPTKEEDSKPTACMQLWRLPPWQTVAIPLSWVVQTVMVVQDFTAGEEPNRFLLNKWFWRTNA